jgi:hypothetical protein
MDTAQGRILGFCQDDTLSIPGSNFDAPSTVRATEALKHEAKDMETRLEKLHDRDLIPA